MDSLHLEQAASLLWPFNQYNMCAQHQIGTAQIKTTEYHVKEKFKLNCGIYFEVIHARCIVTDSKGKRKARCRSTVSVGLTLGFTIHLSERISEDEWIKG
jgi:hypothetical protein